MVYGSTVMMTATNQKKKQPKTHTNRLEELEGLQGVLPQATQTQRMNAIFGTLTATKRKEREGGDGVQFDQGRRGTRMNLTTQ